MKIALCDYFIDDSNAMGALNRDIIAALCDEHQFVLFTHRLDPRLVSPNIRWIKLPLLARRPLFLLFLGFHLMALLYWYGVARGARRDCRIVQGVESGILFSQLIFTHFCHRHFLHQHWRECNRGIRGLRYYFRWFDHYLRASLELWVYRRARWVVAGSEGLKKELVGAYPYLRDKVQVISSPVDIERYRQPAEFDVSEFRSYLKLDPQAVILAFMALGQFERKGLPLLMDAMQSLTARPRERTLDRLKILVVGGEPDLIRSYQKKCAAMGLGDWFHFVGTQKDFRPYIWATDALILPSYYEVFPTMAIAASAASKPLLSTALNGVEDYLVDGWNGLLMVRTSNGIAAAIQRFLNLSPMDRQTMGEHARESMAPYSMANFSRRWHELYARIERGQA